VDKRNFLTTTFSLSTVRLFASLSGSALLAACQPQGAGSSSQKPSFNSVDITGADFAKDFQLTDHNGQARSLQDFRGKIVVVFFGFLNCPDVCPTTLAEWNGIRDQLPADQRDKIQVLFITVDPERDTAAKLKGYVTGFHSTNLGLFGDAKATAETAKSFKVIYQKVEGKTPDNYNMDHTAASFVFDQTGKVRLYVRMGQKMELTASDVKQLLVGAKSG
jgi:protein SCO1